MPKGQVKSGQVTNRAICPHEKLGKGKGTKLGEGEGIKQVWVSLLRANVVRANIASRKCYSTHKMTTTGMGKFDKQ